MRTMQTMLDDERLHQTLLRGHQKMRGDRRQLWRGLDTLACFWRRRNLTIYLRISLRTTAGLLFDFCHRFVQIGKRFSTDNLIAICWLTRRLSLLSPHSSTPSSTLNYKPMLAHSRTTTEQRFRMDALEQGNFAGEHAAVALVAAKKKCSVSEKDVVKTRARALFERHPGAKRVLCRDVPSAFISLRQLAESSSSRSRWPRLATHLSPD